MGLGDFAVSSRQSSGDTLNYHIGKYIGPRVFEIESRFINRQHLVNTQKFFENMVVKPLFLPALFLLPAPSRLLSQVQAA